MHVLLAEGGLQVGQGLLLDLLGLLGVAQTVQVGGVRHPGGQRERVGPAERLGGPGDGVPAEPGGALGVPDEVAQGGGVEGTAEGVGVVLPDRRGHVGQRPLDHHVRVVALADAAQDEGVVGLGAGDEGVVVGEELLVPRDDRLAGLPGLVDVAVLAGEAALADGGGQGLRVVVAELALVAFQDPRQQGPGRGAVAAAQPAECEVVLGAQGLGVVGAQHQTALTHVLRLDGLRLGVTAQQPQADGVGDLGEQRPGMARLQ
ncbi:hypothetical protein GCM10010335_41830 [Streptomyces galbus]|nr:hypothetical protein GCM10010335_41830 [Streptomyces galbus]